MSSNPSPILSADRWSKLFHGWIEHLFSKSHRQGTLHLTDLYDLLGNYQSNHLTDGLEECWLDETKQKGEKASLFRATCRLVRWKPLLIGALMLPLKLFTVTQPLFIIFLMEFFQPCTTMSISSAGLLAICMIFSSFFVSICNQTYFYSIECLALQMRIAYQGLIYRKVLRLSSHSLNRFSSGQITNVFSNDASQIEGAIINFNHIWSTLVDILVMIGFFWYFIQYIVFIAIGYTIVLVICESLLGRILVYFRTKILEVTDQRVKIMSEIIKSMRIIKMYCWESAFEKKIRRIRKQEILRCFLRLMLDSLQMLLSHTYVCMTFLIIFSMMWTIDLRFDTRFFAIAACMLGYIEVSVLNFGTGMHTVAQYFSAEKRIRDFLLLDESKRDDRLLSTSMNDVQMVRKEIVKIECCLEQAKWEMDGLFSLTNIVFSALPGDLICIIGPVGCGKSSLLQTLTGEIAFFQGKVRLYGSFCYVPQESWIFSSTIKKNILFGKDYHGNLLQRVLDATALEIDLAQLSEGINTPVGDQGVMLSGGQKARVNLARALYRDADIYLLDDPLSAVDAKVSKHLFERSIKNYLQDKICILVTHQIQFLQDATKIIVLNNGQMADMGTYTELIDTSPSFRRLLDNIHQQEEQSVDSYQKYVAKSISVSERDDEEDLLLSTEHVEMKREGAVHWPVYASYLRAGAGFIPGIFFIACMFSLRELASIFNYYWLAKWSDDENYRYRNLSNCTDLNDQRQQIVQAMNETQWREYRNDRFYSYFTIAMAFLCLTLLRLVAGKSMCLNAGRVLHNKVNFPIFLLLIRMFRRLIRCPISFFDLNPLGRILNRFTKDMAIVDEWLPWTFFDFFECFFQVFGAVALVSWLNPWALIPTVIAFLSLLFIRYRFAQCSRNLKRLENITRSPIYSYLSSTIHGLKVIRSYHAESICAKEFFGHVDDNTRAGYLFLTTNRWVAIRFDWIGIFFVSVVTFLALIVRMMGRQFSPADIALTMGYSLNLMGILQWTIRQSVEVEMQMTSVERLLDYCELEQESSLQDSIQNHPSAHWPLHGRIVFDDVCMSHLKDPQAPLALNHISLTIEGKEKIGIVGRTGAGKSSFIQTLFRMGHIVHGRIEIDHIDISKVGLEDIRRRISIIPQDPILFTGTMRSNLDQFGDYSDVEIWHALEQVRLKKLVMDIMPNGLQSFVSESGSNLSVGQKQLVCLARAILKRSRILVIDEATANVDNITDELIQRAIREKFKDCTVLTIAHRLRTVIDSDRILVLGDGKVLEFDRPDILLSNANSHFTSLVNQTGMGEADYLRNLVKMK